MIDFSLSDNDRIILDRVRSQALVCRRYARHYDEHEDEMVPDRLPESSEFASPFKGVDLREGEDTAHGVLRMMVAVEQAWGDYAVIMRRVGGGLGNLVLRASGTAAQQERWGDAMLSLAITEPGCGSDSKAIQTTAVLDGDEWVLDGEKIFVTMGCRCEGVVVAATTDRSAGYAGIHSFVVMRGTPGFEIGHREKKLGIRGDDTATMVFRGARIPRDHQLGEGEKGAGGFRGVMMGLNANRPAVAAAGLGIAQAMLDFTRESLASEGIEVDWRVGRQARSAVQQELIEIEADLEAALLDLLHAAWLADGSKWRPRETSIAKAKIGEVTRTATQRCLAILGGLGISRDHLAEKWFRDARVTDLYGGTGEIQRLIIARDILGYSSGELS
jgi:acyl-CoA dehydrogenase